MVNEIKKGISMKFFMFVSMCFIGVVIVSECGHHHKGAGAEKSAAVSVLQPATFIPPADSAISLPQMIAWFGCNHELDSLSERFTQSLSPSNPVIMDSAQKSFSYAQDRICVKQGLRGGYSEYRWISEHLGSTKNKPVYDSVRKKIQGGEK